MLTIVLVYAAAASAAQTPVQRMQQIVQPYVDAQMFMGSVLVARHGKVMFSQSYGMADIEWSIPNSSTTRFNLASMTKQFTAAAVLLLEDRGKLKTDDSIRKYFPEAPASWEKITIYNLLTPGALALFRLVPSGTPRIGQFSTAARLEHGGQR